MGPSFISMWALLKPQGEYKRRRRGCERLWDVALQQKRKQPPQVLSYAAYYARYHTTEERDGWKMENPTGQQVIYVRD